MRIGPDGKLQVGAIQKQEEPVKAEPLKAEGADIEKQFRIWTDASGKFTVEARLKDFSRGKVVLIKRDGTEIAVKPSDLKKEDWEAARSELRKRR